MGGTYRLSRRLFLTAGTGVVGIAVLGACSGSTGSGAAGSGAGAGAGGGAGAGAGSSGPAFSEAGTLTWKQVAMSSVSAYLLVRGKEVALVDTGTASSDGEIDAGLKAAGSDWASVRHVIITHNHPDHAGGWPSVEPHVTAAKAYIGEADLTGVVSTKAPTTVKDGDEVFGLRIIATPGHTAGHISIFDPATGVLVAGDALRHPGDLEGSDPAYTADGAAAAASVKKLAALAPKVILVGHGTPLLQGASGALAKLAATL